MKGIQSIQQIIRLAKRDIRTLDGGHFTISCYDGSLWITWPFSSDWILQSGETLEINTRGKICITALSLSNFQIEKANGSYSKFLNFVRSGFEGRSSEKNRHFAYIATNAILKFQRKINAVIGVPFPIKRK